MLLHGAHTVTGSRGRNAELGRLQIAPALQSRRLLFLADRRRQERHVVRCRRLFLVRLRPQVVEHRLVLIEQPLQLLHERRPRPLQLLDLSNQGHPSRLRVGDDLLRLQLALGDDDVGLLARVRLHFLGHLLRRGQRLLQQLLAVLEFVDPRFPAAQLLVLPVQFADQLLQLRGDQIEPGADLALVEAAQSDLAKGLLVQVEGRQLHVSEDTSAVKVPVRSAGFGETAANTPPRCDALTWYIASSARRIRFSGSRASSGNAATPRLAVSLIGPYCLSARKDWRAISPPMRRAAATAWSLLVSGIRITNSSPP